MKTNLLTPEYYTRFPPSITVKDLLNQINTSLEQGLLKESDPLVIVGHNFKPMLLDSLGVPQIKVENDPAEMERCFLFAVEENGFKAKK